MGEDEVAEPLLPKASSEVAETPRRKLKKSSDSKKSEGKGTNKLGKASSHAKKRGVQRSKSGGVLATKTKGREHRSLSEDGGESTPIEKLKAASEETETPSLSNSKRSKKKVKKSASAKSETQSTSNGSISPTRRSISPKRRSISPLNKLSPKSRREQRSRSPQNEGVHRSANRRSSLSKFKSWWDLSSSKHAKLEVDNDDRDRSPSPPPPPPRHLPSSQSTNTRTMMRKTSESELPPSPSRAAKSAIVTKHKKSSRRRKGSFDSIEENDVIVESRRSLSTDGGETSEDDNNSKSSRKKRHDKEKSDKTSNNYATLLDSPSTSSMTSTTSGESLKDRLKDAGSIPQVASLGQLFDIAQGETRRDIDSEDDDSVGSDSSEHQVKWVELEIDNPAHVVVRAQNEDGSVQTTTVPAGSEMMNTLSDDIGDSFRSVSSSFRSVNETTKPKSKRSKKKKRAKTPSLGEKIGRDQRSAKNRPADERTSCTLGTGGTAESEQTEKAANHDPRMSDTDHQFGSEALKGEDDDDDDNERLGGGSSHSRSSLKSNKSAKSLPARRPGKKKTDKNPTSSNHEPRRGAVRRTNSRRQAKPKSRDAPPRTRSGRATARRGSSHQTKPSSEIDEFMAMTKDQDPHTDPIKEENGDGTMSTATASTMTTETTARSRRSSVGALNPTLVESFQLTF